MNLDQLKNNIMYIGLRRKALTRILDDYTHDLHTNILTALDHGVSLKELQKLSGANLTTLRQWRNQHQKEHP